MNKYLTVFFISFFITNVTFLFFLFLMGKNITNVLVDHGFKFEVTEVSRAKIIELRQIPMFINNNPVIEFNLEVESERGSFILKSHRENIPFLAMSCYKLGGTYKVFLGSEKNELRFDRDNSDCPVIYTNSE